MKALIVYYSRTGVTRTAAERIAQDLRGLGAEAAVEEIVDRKDRSGALGWLSGGRDAAMKRPADIEPMKADPAGFDIVVIGTPVWAWTMTPAIRAFCEQKRDSCAKAAFFCTMGSSGDKGAFKAMTDLCGKEPAATLALCERHVNKEDPEEYLAKVAAFAAALHPKP